MTDEIKPEAEQQPKSEGEAVKTTPEPNQGPSAEELQKQIKELEEKQKAKDAEIADLRTTRATIEARHKQVQVDVTNDTEFEKRLAQIEEQRAYDPQGAAKAMASLLKEVKTKSTEEAVSKARSVISQETTIEKLRNGVKSSNPEFDDDVIDVIMDRANQFASTGQYKTAEEAIKAASDFVKSKFEGYAKKRNTVPPLPSGAKAEGGGANTPPKPQEPEKLKSPLEEIEEHNEARNKKAL